MPFIFKHKDINKYIYLLFAFKKRGKIKKKKKIKINKFKINRVYLFLY